MTRRAAGLALLLFVLVFGAAGAPQDDAAASPGASVPESDGEAQRLHAAATVDSAAPGEPFAFLVPSYDGKVPDRGVLVSDAGTILSGGQFFLLIQGGPDSAPVFAAVIAVPTTAKAGTAVLRGADKSGRIVAEMPFPIVDRRFFGEEILLDQSNTDIRTVPDPKKAAESANLWKLLTTIDRGALFAGGGFVPPVQTTRRTSTFGDRRVYRYVDGSTDTSIHAGIDFGVPRGTPVAAAGDGAVVFAAPRIVTGNSVVIEHLPGVYSLYYHLDRISVKKGTKVKAGDVIGLSGSTGLSTGPHLHWEFRVNGEAADPDAFLSRPILDKDAIIGKMTRSIDSAKPSTDL